MRWLVFVIVLRATVAHACDDADETCDAGPYHRWSWAPLISAQVSYEAEIHTQALVTGELRLRHGSYHDSNVLTASLRVTSANVGTVEPAFVVGYDFIAETFGEVSGYALAPDTRIALGAGRSYGAIEKPFVLAQLSVGALWDQDDGEYRADCGEQGECMMRMQRHNAQLDLVLEARVMTGGDVRLSVGVDIDPIRIWKALAAF